MDTLFGGIVKQVLFEGSRDKALQVFLPLFQNRGIEMNQSQLKQDLLRKFVSEAGMHNLSLGGNYYLCGVARYYFNGDLTTNKRLGLLYPNVTDKFNTEVCERLDALINILRNSYIDSIGTQFEQPEDFGTLTIQALLRKYNKKIDKELGIVTVKPKKEEKVQKEKFTHKAGKKYTYEILYNYEDARKYNRATEPGAWCITYGQQHFNSYISRLGIHYVVFKINGYENVPRKVGKGFTKQKPHDQYGNSLICVLQSNRTPEPIYITSRWNHGSYNDGTSGTEADHAYTTEEFLNVIGEDRSILDTCFREWQLNKGEMTNDNRKNGSEKAKATIKFKQDATRAFKYAQMLMSNGKSPSELFIDSKMWLYNPEEKDWVKYSVGEPETFKQAYKRGAICLCGIKVGDGNATAYAFMRKGQILFDVGIFSDFYYMSIEDYDSSETVLIFAEYCGNRRYYAYNTKLGKFLNVDGVTRFKNTGNAKHKYFIVAVSNNQMALINSETFMPVTTPNGDAWFEDVFTHYRWRRRRGYISLATIDDNAFVGMMYDSASGEQYVFDVASGQFLQSVITYNGNEYRIDSTEVRNYILVQGKRYIRYGGGDDYIYVSPDDNSIMDIFGHTQFTSMYIMGRHGRCALWFRSTLTGEKSAIYVTPCDKLLEFNGTCYFYNRDVNFGEISEPLYHVYSDEMYREDKLYIYNVLSGKYVQIDGTALFERARDPHNSWLIGYRPVGSENTYSSSELREYEKRNQEIEN